MKNPLVEFRARFTTFAIALLALSLHSLPAAGAQRQVLSLTITGGDLSHGAPSVGACSTNPGDFSNFKCLTGGNTTPMLMGSYQPPSLTAFNFFATPVTTFTAASAPGVVPNPTGTPNGTVDDITGAITLDFGGWYAQWSGTNFWQGTNPNNVFSTSPAATGTCTNFTFDTCDFDIRWHSYVTTDPFRGSTWYWHLTGVASINSSCAAVTPISSTTLTGGGQSATVNATLTTTFTGHITRSTNSSVSLCPNTTATYETVSTVGAANCTVSGSAAAATGTVAPGQKLICTNKPTGGDTDRFRILEGP